MYKRFTLHCFATNSWVVVVVRSLRILSSAAAEPQQDGKELWVLLFLPSRLQRFKFVLHASRREESTARDTTATRKKEPEKQRK